MKFICQRLARYPAGIMATSLGNGIKLDSRVIMRYIPIYPRSPIRKMMFSTSQ